MRRFVKVFILLAVLAGGAVAVYAWLAGRNGSKDGFKLVDVGKGSITDKAVAVGKIEPRLKFDVKSKISGIVRAAYFEVGERVRPGDVLFDIVPDPTPAELVEAQRERRAGAGRLRPRRGRLRPGPRAVGGRNPGEGRSRRVVARRSSGPGSAWPRRRTTSSS